MDNFYNIIIVNKTVGYLEKASNSQLESKTANAGYNNYTIFAKWYKEYFGEDFQAQPWCAMFVSDMIYIGFTINDIIYWINCRFIQKCIL